MFHFTLSNSLFVPHLPPISVISVADTGEGGASVSGFNYLD